MVVFSCKTVVWNLSGWPEDNHEHLSQDSQFLDLYSSRHVPITRQALLLESSRSACVLLHEIWRNSYRERNSEYPEVLRKKTQISEACGILNVCDSALIFVINYFVEFRPSL
jgi:hypothetical protein